MKSLKVVFLGTPEFAKTALEAIHKSHHDVVGVVTATDKASGRGQKVNASPVKIYAEEQGLKLFQPEKLRNPEFLEDIKSLNADVFVVVAFRMMPQMLFSIPPMGTFNLHASLLPDYRGAAPINFAIINGETKSGATTFFINEKIDEGNILLQEEVDILPEDNAGSLHDKLMVMGAGLIVKTLDGLALGNLTEHPQPEKENPKTAYKIFKDDLKINWNQNSEIIHNFVRGMSPYPTAFTVLNIEDEEKSLKLFKGKFELNNHNDAAGTIHISKNEFKIATKDGYYYPEELQLQGKKRMLLKDFLNGFRSFEQIKMA
ncbi:methionyl-tRNA formyltransferase [Chryseobacterium sp. TY3]